MCLNSAYCQCCHTQVQPQHTLTVLQKGAVTVANAEVVFKKDFKKSYFYFLRWAYEVLAVLEPVL